MTPEDGGLACTPAGGLVVTVEAERYGIAPGDLQGLIFSGRPAPVVRTREGVGTIEG